MNQVEELISNLCPNGVRYVALAEIVEFANRGVDKVDSPNEREVVLLNYMDVYRNRELSEEVLFARTTASDNQFVECDLRLGDVVITPTSETRDDLAHVSVVVVPMPNTVYSYHVMRLRILNFNEVNPKFLAYQFRSSQLQAQIIASSNGITRFGLTKPKWEALQIQLPPLAIQEEIVEILDKFKELQEALEEEFDARRSQHVYYRNQLLSFKKADSDEVTWAPLGEVAKNLDSKRKPVTRGLRSSGQYPYYGASGIVDYVGDFLFNGDYLLVSEDGANLLARSTPIAFSISGKNWVNNHAHVLEFETYEMRRIVEFYLNSIDLSPYVAGGAQPKLSQSNMNKIPVPVPTGALLTDTVTALDAFESFLKDEKIGLPAEISARRKQYEYYRNKLLTFKKLEVA
jgi:type I restriction enzyme S subunit